MRYRWLAAWVAVAALALAGQGGGSVALPAEHAEAAQPAPTCVGDLLAPTLGGMQFWADELFFHQWRIQRNTTTGHYRLLDENYLRYASGTYEQCVAKLEEIKRDRKLPAMQGKAVVVLHGLARTRTTMLLLADYLERAGGYTVFNVGYPSTRESIGDHARALARIIENLEGIEEINFVGQSMGNIVIRHYLADQTDEATGRRPDPRIRRFVMLGPPNHGSIAATRFAHSRVFTTVLGKPGQQLGREWVWLESDLATPQCEFGIVAGGLGNGQGFNPMLPGDDDGLVTVASTRLVGATDFVVVPVMHMLLPDDPRVWQYTLRFLQKGCFISANQRQPVTAE